jgi:hypothetical protein
LLETAAGCFSATEPTLSTAVLDDGIVRRTFSASLTDNTKREFPCGEAAAFQSKLQRLTAHVDAASELVARNMDLALAMAGAHVEVPIVQKEWFEPQHTLSSMQDIVGSTAGHLDHVHVYAGGSDAGAETLSMHTDAGLFIAIVPGMYFDADGASTEEPDDSGFVVETRAGEAMKIDVPDDVVLFMSGVGLRDWLGLPMDATRHALQLPKDADVLRSWFGRMYRLPEDALLPVMGEKYGDVARRALREGNGGGGASAGLACPAGYEHRVLQNDDECQADEFFCWMSCCATATQECNDFGQHMNTCFDKLAGYDYATGPYYYEVTSPSALRTYTSGRLGAGDTELGLDGTMTLTDATAACDGNTSCTGFYWKEALPYDSPQRQPQPTEAMDFTFSSSVDFFEDVFNERYHAYVKSGTELTMTLELPEPVVPVAEVSGDSSMEAGAIVGIALGVAAVVGIVGGITLGAVQYFKVRRDLTEDSLTQPLTNGV